MKPQTKGLVIVYTGNGKGKTTAALGLVLRASGYGKKVRIIQFMKQWETGEYRAIQKYLPTVEISKWGDGWVKIMGDQKPLKTHTEAVRRAFEEAVSLVKTPRADVVVLDELLSALAGKLVTEKQILTLIAAKAPALDLVITGHKITKKIEDAADLVTDMRKIKHPYDKGFIAKRGIDF